MTRFACNRPPPLYPSVLLEVMSRNRWTIRASGGCAAVRHREVVYLYSRKPRNWRWTCHVYQRPARATAVSEEGSVGEWRFVGLILGLEQRIRGKTYQGRGQLWRLFPTELFGSRLLDLMWIELPPDEWGPAVCAPHSISWELFATRVCNSDWMMMRQPRFHLNFDMRLVRSRMSLALSVAAVLSLERRRSWSSACARERASRYATQGILGNTTSPARALQDATRTIPIVFTNLSNPIGSGSSRAWPGPLALYGVQQLRVLDG